LLKVFIYLFMCHSEEKTTKDIRVWGLRRAPGSGPEGAGAVPPKQQYGKVHKGFGSL